MRQAKCLWLMLLTGMRQMQSRRNIILQTGTFTGTAKVSELNGKNLTARSTKTEPAVTVSTREVKFTGNTINYSFAAHSLTQIEIPVK